MADSDKLRRLIDALQKKPPEPAKFPLSAPPAGAVSLARLLPSDEQERFLEAWKPRPGASVSPQRHSDPTGPADPQGLAGTTGSQGAASTESRPIDATGPTSATGPTGQPRPEALPAESAQQAEPRKLTPKQAKVLEIVLVLYPDLKVLAKTKTAVIEREVNTEWKRRDNKDNLATYKTVARALGRDV